MRLAGCLCALLVVPVLASGAFEETATGTRFEPPDGRVYAAASTSGIEANYDSFLSVANQPSVAIYNRFGGKGLADFRWVLSEFRKRDVAGMVSWYNFRAQYEPDKPGGSSASIARGDVDRHIIDRAAEVREYGEPLFIRMNWEMNGFWFAYSAYDKQGNLRRDNAHAHYRNAWRRTVELFRGGTAEEINKRLSALHLPVLAVDVDWVAPADNVSWVWNPSHGTQWKDRQAVFDYYPGDGFVDWVGVDWYPYGPGDTQRHVHQQGRSVPGPQRDLCTLLRPGKLGSEALHRRRVGCAGLRPAGLDTGDVQLDCRAAESQGAGVLQLRRARWKQPAPIVPCVGPGVPRQSLRTEVASRRIGRA